MDLATILSSQFWLLLAAWFVGPFQCIAVCSGSVFRIYRDLYIKNRTKQRRRGVGNYFRRLFNVPTVGDRNLQQRKPLLLPSTHTIQCLMNYNITEIELNEEKKIITRVTAICLFSLSGVYRLPTTLIQKTRHERMFYQ